MYVKEQEMMFSSIKIPPNVPHVHDKVELTVPTGYTTWCHAFEECFGVALKTHLVVVMGNEPGRTQSAISKRPALQL